MLDYLAASSYFKSVQLEFLSTLLFLTDVIKYTPYPSTADKKKNQDSFSPQN